MVSLTDQRAKTITCLMLNVIIKEVDVGFLFVGSSAMSASSQYRVRHGRPFGGVGIMVRKSLLPVFKCAALQEHIFVTEIASVRVKIITQGREKRLFDGSVIYNCVGCCVLAQ